jgi:hypothetical protein
MGLNTAMLRSAILLATLAASIYPALAAPPPDAQQQPVLIVLYSRFYDHTHSHTTDERLARLLPLLEKLRDKYPQYTASALLQFSGTVSQVLAEQNAQQHLVDKILADSRKGIVDIGYTGEEEPSYLHRPRPDLLSADTPQARWSAKAEAAERFLNDFKDPVTGEPFPGLLGGLARVQEAFGPATFVTGITTTLGADSAVTHEVRKLTPNTLMAGIPPVDARKGITGYAFSAENFSNFISPLPLTSPEVFWEDGVLRISGQSLPDNVPHSTDETPEALKKAFARLDRSHVRVIKLEVASYRERYLTKRADGSVIYDPMEWLYYHPDNPEYPASLKPLVQQGTVEAGYKNEEAVLNWLVTEFLPANPGSRFLSMRDLASLAPNQAGSTVTSSEIKAIASDIDARFKELPMQAPRFVSVGDRYYSDAEAFEILAEALASMNKTGMFPESVKLTHMYGPFTLPEDMGPAHESMSVADVRRAAAEIAEPLRNDTWKPVPDNAIPASIKVGTAHLNAAQFLNLMAWACLDPTPEKILHANATAMTSSMTFMFPKDTPIWDQGNAWTFKPAVLRLESAAATAGAH